MILSQFRGMFPEFRATSDEMIEGFLGAASVEISESLYGDKYDSAHGFLAAHMLAVSPFGKASRTDNKDEETTTYWRNYARIRKLVAPRQLVT
jgi:hypothetical protein